MTRLEMIKIFQEKDAWADGIMFDGKCLSCGTPIHIFVCCDYYDFSVYNGAVIDSKGAVLKCKGCWVRDQDKTEIYPGGIGYRSLMKEEKSNEK